MADMDMSHSLSSLPPLGEPPTVDLDLSLNSNYSASPGESPSGNTTVSDETLTYNEGLLVTSQWSDYSDFENLSNSVQCKFYTDKILGIYNLVICVVV